MTNVEEKSNQGKPPVIGRKRGRPRLSVEHHKAAGTYRSDRHGPRLEDMPVPSEWTEPAPDAGQRFSHEWAVLLTDDPRRRLDEGADPATATEAPYNICDMSFSGYESSFMYLLRRGLLRPGEVEQIRESHADRLAGRILFCHYHRHPRESTPASCHSAETAAMLQIFGPHPEMTAGDVEAGEQFLREHREAYPLPIVEAALQPFNE